MSHSVLDSPIEYLKGVGPTKAKVLQEELGVRVFRDLLFLYPFRYIDKTQFHDIGTLTEEIGEVQVKGILRRLTVQGQGRKQRLVGVIRDPTGAIEIVWFKGIKWIEDSLDVGKEYVIYGKVSAFGNRISMAHPEVEELKAANAQAAMTFAPVYSSTEKLNAKGLDVKARRQLIQRIFGKLKPTDIPETLPDYLVQRFKFPSRFSTLMQIHFPENPDQLNAATNRLKFEELFFLQLRLLQVRNSRRALRGYQFESVGAYFHQFYQEKIPFELTDAQKRVIKEIRRDLGLGQQMNRLLQGDVGSGKTMVGLMTMLIALDNNFQACLLAPTEILAQQHFLSITEYLEGMEVEVGFLSGSVKGRARKDLFERLEAGKIDILIGTHAILEDPVKFNQLGLAITDEQHRFGVAQRAKLWKKSKPYPPHVLVMTATPIPRTLAMTLYGDLDVSVIDELPPGRKPVLTQHRTEAHRMRVFGFMREEIAKGRQIYVVYPLIEESEKLDLNNLQEGYEALSREFPRPEYQISVVHGRMKPGDKDFEMQRFVRGETQIMVATTVIEVGVNVPNASVMVIENTERFGLSQLHQLRGRVGRGAEQSYCILMTGYKLSEEGRERIDTMVRTNNGFEIAEADLRLRGPGNIQGTQQSGMIQLRIADLARDSAILQTAREIAKRILEADPKLEDPRHQNMVRHLKEAGNNYQSWSRIS